MNLSNPIWQNCHAFPDRAAVINNGMQMTYAQLFQRVASVANRLSTAGIGPGDVVAIGVNTPLAFLLILLATVRIGATASPIVGRWPDQLKETILGRHQVKGLVQTPDDNWRSTNPAITQYFDALRLLEPTSETGTSYPPVINDVDDMPWYLSLSSGTTGTPKTIARTHQREMLLGLSYPEWDRPDQARLLVYMSVQIPFGLGAILRALINGRTVIMFDSMKHEEFFKAVERDRPTLVLTSTGNAAQLLAHALQHFPDAKARCASLQTFAMGGSEASPALLRGVEEHFCDNYEIRYASSEGGMLALANKETLAARPQMRAGRLMPWVTAEAIDEEGNALPPGKAGELRFRTPFAIQGYLGDVEATSHVIRDGWIHSGDVGIVGPAGYLRLLGRIDARINLGGNKVDPARIEAIINTHPAVLESAVVLVDSPEHPLPLMTAAIVMIGGGDILESQFMAEIRELCNTNLEPISHPKQLVKINALPKNAGGKVMRQKLAAELTSALFGKKDLH